MHLCTFGAPLPKFDTIFAYMLVISSGLNAYVARIWVPFTHTKLCNSIIPKLLHTILKWRGWKQMYYIIYVACNTSGILLGIHGLWSIIIQIVPKKTHRLTGVNSSLSFRLCIYNPAQHGTLKFLPPSSILLCWPLRHSSADVCGAFPGLEF